jgi:DNA-binding CsgD family transcriptional regulator
METQLDRHCSDALRATSVKELLRKMVAFSQDRGFWSVSATVITKHSPKLQEHQYLTNASAADLPEFEDLETALVDPVAQRASKRSSPLVWDRGTYLSCGTPAQVKCLVEEFQLFAAHVQVAACELCFHLDPLKHEQPSPTAGELEALRWAMDGMTRWEIGRKRGLSERDVALRFERVVRKLGCSSTYEAVLGAIRAGLIECN